MVDLRKNIKRILKVFCIIYLLFTFFVCSTAQESVIPDESEDVSSRPAEKEKPSTAEDSKLTERLESFLENGITKIDRGLISEGITQLVSILAETDKRTDKSEKIKELIHTTETELSKIRAGLSMESGLEWLDDNKNQISASSIDIGTDKGFNPSVILTLNFGAGKALVSSAPIFFEFVKGSGLLTSFVNTNEYGQANCSIARLENANEENIIRASLIYRVKGYSYIFQGIAKDFVYIPPARKATILVLEKAKNTISEDPVILDAVYNKLKGVAFDFSQYNGVLLGDDFIKVFGGDPEAIVRMGLEKGVSYLVLVLNDGYYVKQVELSGKKYNIYKSQTTATTRIIRVIDGKIMYSGTVQGVSGQGGSEQKAIIDGFRNASDAMADKLEKELTEINEALSGAKE